MTSAGALYRLLLAGAPKAVTDKLQQVAATPQHVSSATRGSLTTV